MPTYTLHRIAVNEYNAEPGYAMRNSDGEAFDLYDEEDMRGVYEMLRAYFERGEISTELVEREEMEFGCCQLWQAVRVARDYGAPAALSDEQIAEGIMKAAQRGAIKGAHPSIDGLNWWFSRRGLEDYFYGLRWGERRTAPHTDKPTITLPDEPFGQGGLTLADVLADGREIAHQDKTTGIWYQLYLDANDQIIGVYDEEHYESMSATRPAGRDPKEHRVKVLAGQYEIGDYIDGRQIVSFGRGWAESPLNDGQLWQSCARGDCEREPVCVTCERCSLHCDCDSWEYKYAYFS